MLLAVGASGRAAAAPAGTRALAAGGAVRFEVLVPAAHYAPLPLDSTITTVALSGYGLEGEVGSPGLPGRSVLVAVPPQGAVEVRATSELGESRGDLTLAPIPERTRDAEGITATYRRDARAYAAPTAGPRARLLGVGWLRNQRVARIAILPADYDPVDRRLEIARRIEVEVTVAAPAPTLAGGSAAPSGRPAEELDPFERIYAGVLVNYEQGKAWRRAAGTAYPSSRAGGGLAGIAAPAGLLKIATGDTVYAGRQWIKLAVSAPGVYKVDYGTLRNLRPFAGGAVVRSDDMRLYTWRSPLPVLPEGDYCDTCSYHEVPIATVDTGTGNFNDANANYFYFFALGPSDWANLYDPTKPDTSFFNHPYETRNLYYLTVSTAAKPILGPPLRIASVDADADTITGSPVTMRSFPERVHYEHDNEYFPDSPPLPNSNINGSGTLDTLSWQKWFWKSLGSGESFGAGFDLPGLDASAPVNTRIRLWGLVNGFTNIMDLSLNGDLPQRKTWSNKNSMTYELLVSNPIELGNTALFASISNGFNRNNRIGLAWLDAFYTRRLVPVGDSLTFVAPAGTGRAVYRIGPFSSTTPPRLFDVTDGFAPFEVKRFDYQALDPTHWELAFATNATEPRRYHVVPDTKIARLLGSRVFEAPRTSLTDLRKISADYVVIYYDAFGAAAESLAAWRHSHLPMAGKPAPYDTATVPISAIFDQFSGGRTDPLAIRNFLRAVFLLAAGSKVSFVTLLGDASYDYKNVLGKAGPGQPACLLPTYENGYDPRALGGHQFTTDDWLMNVDNADIVVPDFFSARIPVSDATTAMNVVRNKILFYERSTPLDVSRNRVMLIADDNMKCDQPDEIGWGHLDQTAELDINHIPPHMDREYVYLHTYPNGTASCLKPDAKADIKKNLQDGVAMFNYIGHGSPFQITDEQVLVEPDIGTLTNGPRYPLFAAASCDVGLFNDPTITSLGEQLITTSGGGAISVISATQLAFSNDNAALNGDIYDVLFGRAPAAGGQYHTSIAEALLAAKEKEAGGSGLSNDVKYQVMGDAGTALNLPKLWVQLALTDTLGSPVTQLTRGQSVRFSGQVLDGPGGTPLSYNGTANLLVEDSPPIDTPPGPGGDLHPYPFRAGPVYRADLLVTGGTLAGRFVVPLEAREGANGRVRAYATGNAAGGGVPVDAVGSQYAQVVAGPAPTGDNEGPHILLSFAGGALEVRPDALLNVDITDPSGVLITDHTPQNAIVVTLDDNSNTRSDITASFRYAANSFQSGRATFPLPGLAAGPHRIKVSAADNLASGFSAAAHRSSAVIDFRVVPSQKLAVARAYLFPDPTHSRGPGRGGQFVVDTPGDTVNVLLRIYTVSGRLIRTLESLGGHDQTQLAWDGLDDEREPLANGVYLFKVNVNGKQVGGPGSTGEHAIAQGRFVVLNR